VLHNTVYNILYGADVLYNKVDDRSTTNGKSTAKQIHDYKFDNK